MDRSLISNYREEFAQWAPQLAGAHLPALRQARLDALDQFDTMGFPTTKLEDWKYTNVSAIAKHAFKLAAVPSDAQVDQWTTALHSIHASGDDCLVFINGWYSKTLSRRRQHAGGVFIASMRDALAEDAGDIDESLINGMRREENGFTALNAAWWTDGAYIKLPNDVALDHAIHLVFICTEDESACHMRNIVHAGAGAHATVIEHYFGAKDAPYFTNAITYIEANRAARIEHYKVQQESARSFHIASIQTQQQQDSHFTSLSIAFGGLLSRTDIATRFAGEGCNATLNGLYVAGGRQHIDHHTRIDHVKPHGVSREYYKGVLDGAARGVFNGKVVVHADAQHSDAFQSNRNLLLSENAEIDTKPQLEIYADDVKCNHGATVGQLDENQIFYLRSRGMEDTAARSLLTYAFAEEIIAQVRVEALRDQLRHKLEQLLHQPMPLQRTADSHGEVPQ